MNFLQWLCLLFIGLKLTGHIAWSWWFVLAPFVGGVILAACADVAKQICELSSKRRRFDR